MNQQMFERVVEDLATDLTIAHKFLAEADELRKTEEWKRVNRTEDVYRSWISHFDAKVAIIRTMFGELVADNLADAAYMEAFQRDTPSRPDVFFYKLTTWPQSSLPTTLSITA